MPFQSEKQRRYLWANEPEIAKRWERDYANGGAIQGGGPNYLGKQKMVKAPKKWQSSPDHEPAELAYITEKEKDILIDLDLYGSLNGKPNRGPSGIISLQGDMGSIGGGHGDTAHGRGGRFDVANRRSVRTRTADERGTHHPPSFTATGSRTPKAAQQRGGQQYLDNRYLNWLASQKSTADEEEEDTTPSAFQQSLTGTADTPDYYVGETPLASNLAWGQKFGVDPRTMYKTSWANGGRIPAAFGGIMDSSTGRRAYGFGSIFKSIGKAAKKVLKSKVGKAALTAAAMYYGPKFLGPGKAGFGQWKNVPWLKGALAQAGSPNQKAGWLRNMFSGGKGKLASGWNPWKIGIAGLTAAPFFMSQPEEDDEGDKGSNYDVLRDKYASELMNIKRGLSAGSLNPEQWSYLPSDYVYKGAEGGRAGYYAGGQSTPSDYTVEDAMMTTTQDKLGGITDVMKQADLNRQGSVGQFYAADGGRIGYNKGGNYAQNEVANQLFGTSFNVLDPFQQGQVNDAIGAYGTTSLGTLKAQGGRIGYDAGGQTGHPPITIGQVSQIPPQMPAPQPPQSPMPAPQPNPMAMMNPMMARGMNPMMGGRRMAKEGGLMDLGGMEKDYRQEGGFVPLGGEEKADDVPARLSKNEFVFTADAVRAAGGGDVDAGAEIMENVMENLEQGGQISEESQGLAGAQEMFGVSERLSEVV